MDYLALETKGAEYIPAKDRSRTLVVPNDTEVHPSFYSVREKWR